MPKKTGQNVTVTVSPPQATLGTFGKQTFSATVTGSTNTAVTWQVNGVTGGAAATGIISASGAYSAPHSIAGSIMPANPNNPVTVTVTAVSQANTAATSIVTVTLVPQGQNAESGAVELGTSGGNIHASSTSGNTITCCGGTLGSLIVNNGTDYILSNNHVLANSDAGTIGDAITQPGLIDAQCQTTGTATVANLSQFLTLENNPPNPIDAAIAQIVSGKVDTSGNILLLGATTDANGVPVPGPPEAGPGEAAAVGLAVAKSGRTTGLTCSTVDSISAAFSVQYQKGCGTGAMFTLNYTGQISVLGGGFSNEGDSGSLIVRQDTANAVALLFAGSDTDAVGNPIGAVLNAFATNNGVPTIVGGAAHQVIGCTLPLQGATRTTQASVAVSAEAMQAAQAARDANAPKLLSIAGVRGVSIGSSLDYPGQAALLLFVDPGTPRSSLPAQVDGVRTRIVETSNEAARGILSAEDAQALAPEQPNFAVTGLSEAELARGKAAQAAHVEEWMRQPGVQGFGVTSSADSPGEAALMIFLIRGAPHNAIPVEIDGLRTRVRESSRFHAGLDGLRPHAGCSVPPSKTASFRNASSAQAQQTHP
ncbi:MAG TPA: hypothetical protein VE077_15600 [Candidatus Methylomirabilis sp.]|nr:hypothetical protein [Candidatus Methylomirabilis sp.]